jgi:hypothetical protein
VYNNFRVTERCIEIPIIRYYLDKYPHERVLEIGNVTKYYYDKFRDFKEKDTIDKYEAAYDVINMDIKEYKTKDRYDFIYSISTFEHMDSDGGRNPVFTPKSKGIFTSYAFENLNHVINNLLIEKGKFIVTFPLGYCNCEIDRSLYSQEYEAFKTNDLKIYVMKRVDELKWKQLKSVEEGKNAKEDTRLKKTAYICIMEITK